MTTQSHFHGSVAAVALQRGRASLWNDLFLSLFVCVASLSIGSNAMAQAGRGGITGLVTDSSGAVVPGGRVQIVNEATRISQETVTTSAGLYSFNSILPGTYELTVTYEGFQKHVQRPVRVEVDRVTEVNAVLKPGEISQTISVTEEAALANTTSSTIGQLITAKTLESVPLNGRDVFLLVQLSPGVVPLNGAVNETGAYTRPGVSVSGIKINGQQSGSLAYMMDGSPLTVDGFGLASSSPALTPPLEAVQEYRVETNNLLPSFLSPGTGVISLASKSGGDKFHGSAFGFARPNALAANDPFLKAAQIRSGQPNKPADFRRYQWGGSMGGPIKKGKLFFFGDYEGTFTRRLDTLTTTVPTEAERRGDFSQVPTIYNPFDVNAAGQRQPFANNAIPANMQNPVARAMLKFFPAPNQAGTGPYHLNNYFDAALTPDDAQKFDIRLDSHFHTKHQLFGRYSFARNYFTGLPDHYHNDADPLHFISITRSQNFLLADNYTLSPTTLLELRYTFTRHAERQPAEGIAQDFDITTVGFPASLDRGRVIRSIPVMDVAGMRGVGSMLWATGFRFISFNHDVLAGLSTVKGRHNLKTGFEYRKSFVNMGQQIGASGWYQFDGTATSSKTFAGDGYGFASFLLGMGTPFPTPFGFTSDPFVAQASPYYASYAEDTIRMTTKLTLNLGLRWEIFGGRTERYDRQNYFDPNAQFTVNGVNLIGGSRFPTNNESPFKTNYKNFGPRFGLAYQPFDRMVVHGGFGIFFGPSPHSVAVGGTNADSFSSRTTWNAVTFDPFGNTVLLNPLNNPFPNGLILATQGKLGLATNLGTTLSTMQRSQPEPSAYNWNFGIQYELPHGFLVSTAYVGSRGLHQIAGINLNQLSLEQIAQYGPSLNDQVPNPYLNAITNPSAPFYNRSTIPRWQALAPYPQFASGGPGGGVGDTTALADSIYHSVQAKVEKRLSTHFSTLASFTFGKVIGVGIGPYSYLGSHGAFAQNWRNLRLDRAVDPQDVSRWFSWAMFYDLPIGEGRAVNTTSRFAKLAFGGWTVNSVLYLASGIPIIPSGNFPNRSVFFNQRPNLKCDPSQGAPKTADRWFLPDCFAAPASPFVAGNAPRTLPNVRADGTGNLDFSVFKNFPWGEGKNLQFRAEAFNLTNSVQLGLPNATWNPVDLSTFGRITTAASTPRQWQFALRFTF
ncbi:MAG: carboxypeptidase regulatory-like domain-containing protein [Acidobacteria bacterium]|nr:carboxypeptidase regulatory-like domain-containing protein [Acidobacteriota bacterium]